MQQSDLQVESLPGSEELRHRAGPGPGHEGHQQGGPAQPIPGVDHHVTLSGHPLIVISRQGRLHFSRIGNSLTILTPHPPLLNSRGDQGLKHPPRKMIEKRHKKGITSLNKSFMH